jgi:hypothetical protein
MPQIAPVSRVSAPLPLARTGSATNGVRSSVGQANKAPAANQPSLARDECHCDDGPERMVKRAIHARW